MTSLQRIYTSEFFLANSTLLSISACIFHSHRRKLCWRTSNPRDWPLSLHKCANFWGSVPLLMGRISCNVGKEKSISTPVLNAIFSHCTLKKNSDDCKCCTRNVLLASVVKHILGIVCYTVQRRRHALFYDDIPHPQRLQAVHIRNIKHFLGCQGYLPFVFSLAWLSYSLLLIYDVGYFCDIVM